MELKPPKSYEQQVQRIKDHGFKVNCDEELVSFLQRANYYRFSAYFLPFRIGKNHFRPNTSLFLCRSLYEFDSEIRMWLYHAIEHIEYYLRTQLAYYVGHKYQAIGYLEPTMYSARHKHGKFLDQIDKLKHQNKNTQIVKHHKKKYNNLFPIWVIIEFFSTGMLSIFYADLKIEDKKQIARHALNTGHMQLESWLRAFSELRNKCAHYTRFYYWPFTSIPKNLDKKYSGIEWKMDNTLFSQIYMLKQLYPDKSRWAERSVSQLKSIINEYSDSIELNHIGFPENWEELLLHGY